MKLATGGGATVKALLAFLPLSLAGCDDSFQPFVESDFDLSIMGYLDASADTQWIRVTPIRNTIVTGDQPLEASVAIERTGSGKSVSLMQSVFRYRSVFVENTADQLAYAYWTQEKITPGSSYQLTVTLPGPKVSTKTVVIPDDYPVVIRNAGANVYLRVGVEHLALVNIRCGPGGGYTAGPLDVPFTFAPAQNGVFQVWITRFLTRYPGDFFCPTRDTEIFVVVSGEPWPAGSAVSSSALLMLDTPSGITNGLGFVGGVLTKKVPWSTCTWSVPPISQPVCDLVYNADSVQLEGNVIDTACGKTTKLTHAEIQLTEILPDPDQRRRVWTEQVDSTGMRVGSYKISLLEKGRYVARVSSILWDPPNVARTNPQAKLIYGTVQDTLTFIPGQRATYNVTLPRLLPCLPA